MTVIAGDLHTLITADGIEFHVPDEENRFLAYMGYGAPPINYMTRKSYKQHGSTKIDYTLDNRPLSITLWKKAACDRAEYWANRMAVHELLRPNRGGSLTLVLETPGGVKRAIKVDPNPGALFNVDMLDDNSWQIEEPIEFTAFNPIWYDPLLVADIQAQDVTQGLIFPLTFPIVFGPGGITFDMTVQYTGTWVSYPSIRFTGPYTNAIIENMTTGALIELFVPISTGQTRTINLQPGALSVVDHNGVNRWEELTAESNLVDFAIHPDPIAPDGVNEIQARIERASTDSRVTLEYYTRYYAI